MSVVLEKKFIKDVEMYVFKNDKKYVNSIKTKLYQIPAQFRKGGMFYRGMVLDPDLVDAITKQSYKDFVLEDITSWTTDENMARRFVSDQSKMVREQRKGVGVIFKQKIPDSKVILNLHDYCMFIFFSGIAAENDFDELNMEMALEEKEVLVDAGIRLLKANVHKIVNI